jgi:hypothetical protein
MSKIAASTMWYINACLIPVEDTLGIIALRICYGCVNTA